MAYRVHNVEEMIVADVKVIRCRSCGRSVVVRHTLFDHTAGCNICLPEPSSNASGYLVSA